MRQRIRNFIKETIRDNWYFPALGAVILGLWGTGKLAETTISPIGHLDINCDGKEDVIAIYPNLLNKSYSVGYIDGHNTENDPGKWNKGNNRIKYTRFFLHKLSSKDIPEAYGLQPYMQLVQGSRTIARINKESNESELEVLVQNEGFPDTVVLRQKLPNNP